MSTTTNMIAPAPGTTFPGCPSGTTYRADASGNVANVKAMDVVALIDGGCLFPTGGGSPSATLVAASGTAQPLAWGLGKDVTYDLTLTADFTPSFSPLGTAGLMQQMIIFRRQDAVGGHAFNIPSGFEAAQGYPYTPTPGANTLDILVFASLDGGNTGVYAPWGTNFLSAPVAQVPSSSPIPPNAPAITVTPANGQNTIAWADGLSNGAAITSHKLYRGTSSGTETLLGTITTGSPYIDSGLTNGAHYFYQLTALNSAGESSKSVEQSGTPSNAPAHYYYTSSNSNSAQNVVHSVTGTGFDPGTAIVVLTAEVNLASYTTGGGTIGALFGAWHPNGSVDYVFGLNQSGYPIAQFIDASNVHYSSFAGNALASTVAPPGTVIGLGMILNNNATTGSATVGNSTFSVPANSLIFLGSTDYLNWTALGSTITITSGGAGLLASPSFLIVANASGGGEYAPVGNFYKTMLSIGGTIVASPDFTAQATGTTSFTDAQGNSWTVTSPGSIV